MTNTVVGEALEGIGVTRSTWKTLVVLASAETDLPPKALWDSWSRIEGWAAMTPLITSAEWVNGDPWQPGSAFVQGLSLGFPVGSQTSDETVGSVIPGVSAQWVKDEKGIRSNHIWQFDSLENGGTHITNVEVFHGLTIGLIKVFVAKRWQRLFQAHVDGLVKATGERS